MTEARAAPTSVLVVDDDATIRELVCAYLRTESCEVAEAATLREARAVLRRSPIDVVVLDLNLPDGDGVELCRELRALDYGGAIVMVSARDATADRILGLELGGDDYLVKPFEARELAARIRSVLRRTLEPRSAPAAPHRFATFGGWRLDLLRRRLFAQDQRLVMLTAGEFEVLSRLVRHAGQVLGREQLLPDRAATAAFDRSIDMLVSRLRQKLGVDPDGEPPILTVRSRGYMLAMDVAFE